MGQDCDSKGSPYDDVREGRGERERGERGRQAGRQAERGVVQGRDRPLL